MYDWSVVTSLMSKISFSVRMMEPLFQGFCDPQQTPTLKLRRLQQGKLSICIIKLYINSILVWISTFLPIPYFSCFFSSSFSIFQSYANKLRGKIKKILYKWGSFPFPPVSPALFFFPHVPSLLHKVTAPMDDSSFVKLTTHFSLVRWTLVLSTPRPEPNSPPSPGCSQGKIVQSINHSWFYYKPPPSLF